MGYLRIFFLILIGAALLIPPIGAFDIILPTENDALFRGDGHSFYMHTDRNFEGVKSTPWEGGQYGFVRNPTRSGGRILFTRFHEGIDIRPVRRNRSGEPLDPVVAVADGKVVYRTRSGATSGYGHYVVIEHIWEGSPYYSLYAHLNRVDVSVGKQMRKGEQLGILGYTGTGINKERAHLHFEINLFLSSHFEKWHREFFPSQTNHHGLFNGINLAGFDVARFYLEHRKNPTLTPAQFLSRLTPHFTVRVPSSQPPQVARRYPWMAPQRLVSRTGAWDISFDASGLPLRVIPSSSGVASPEVVSIKETGAPHRQVTRNLVQGAGNQASLTDGGTRLIRLIFME